MDFPGLLFAIFLSLLDGPWMGRVGIRASGFWLGLHHSGGHGCQTETCYLSQLNFGHKLRLSP